MWLLMTTITTVGFGDTYPKSHVGRGVCAFSMILSLLMMSLVTAALTKHLALSSDEAAIVAEVHRSNFTNKLKRAAAKNILLTWKSRKEPRSIKRGELRSMRERCACCC